MKQLETHNKNTFKSRRSLREYLKITVRSALTTRFIPAWNGFLTAKESQLKRLMAAAARLLAEYSTKDMTPSAAKLLPQMRFHVVNQTP